MSTNPFIKFCHEKRDEVKAANPNANPGDVARILSSLWKETKQIETPVYVEPHTTRSSSPEAGLRRSSRLRNKRLGLDFWGLKLKK